MMGEYGTFSVTFQFSLETSGMLLYFASMNGKQRKTLQRIFGLPVPSNIEWIDIETLLLAVGCTLTEGSGSRVKFNHGAATISFHRPHPKKEAIRYQVRDARAFLEKIGVKP